MQTKRIIYFIQQTCKRRFTGTSVFYNKYWEYILKNNIKMYENNENKSALNYASDTPIQSHAFIQRKRFN